MKKPCRGSAFNTYPTSRGNVMKTTYKISALVISILALSASGKAYGQSLPSYLTPLPDYSRSAYPTYYPPSSTPAPAITPYVPESPLGSSTSSSGSSGYSSSDSYRSITPSYGSSSSAGSTYSRDPVQGMTTELPSGFYGGPAYSEKWYVPAPVESDPRYWVY
jgi:hypothetical protein